MRLKFVRWVLPLCYCLLVSPLFLHASDTLLSQKPKTEQATSPVVTKLMAENNTIQPGTPFWVGVELKMDEGWDTYWINPGDSGFPTKVDWKLPPGFTASPLQWPYPERFVSQTLVGYGYTHSVLLLSEITPPANLEAGKDVKLAADVSWLACKEQCVPGNAHIDLNVPVSSESPQKDPAIAAAFTTARSTLPKSLAKDEGVVTTTAKGKEIILNLTGNFKEIVDAIFIPETAEMIDHGAPQQFIKGDHLYTLNVKMAHPEKAPSHVKGILLVSEKGSTDKKAIAVDVPMTAGQVIADPATTTTTQAPLGMSLAIVFAFIGGLILNVMPCVLPVIALKIFSFVKMSGERRSTLLKHGGVFALGVLVSFWVLSGILLILRAYGEGIGWGFQLQEPLFVIGLTIVLFVLALSLFGLFELGTSLIALGQKGSSSKSPFKNSFLSGVLATVVATPCTGPLLGPALGFAMTMPPAFALLIFTSMGLGMASPYLLFSAFPKLIRFLPKPGNWMIVFKQLMGFLMLATCLWLIWVFSAQTTMIATFVLLGALLIIAVGGWIYGNWATPLKSKRTRLMATSVAMLLLFTSGWVSMNVAKEQKLVAHTETVKDSGQWQKYSPEKVAELRKEGKPVFIDFTAKWCLICQANKVTLHSSEVQKAFAEKGIVTMEADWTKRDPVITSELEKLGRSGVPVYVLYSPDMNEPPRILPQTLTKSVVTDYIDQLTTPSTTVMN
jgi:thiol:disulfide interchange protein